MNMETLQTAKKCEWNIATINVDLKKLDEMLDSEKPCIQYDFNSCSVRYIELDEDAKTKVHKLLKAHLSNKKKRLEKELASL